MSQIKTSISPTSAISCYQTLILFANYGKRDMLIHMGMDLLCTRFSKCSISTNSSDTLIIITLQPKSGPPL
jgi:hypothetical protein